MYYLQKTNEPKTDITSSFDREELMEKMRNLYIADRDTNEDNEYRVVSANDIKKEDYVENQLKKIKEDYKKVLENREALLKGILLDLKSYKLLTESLYEAYKNYGRE